MDSLDDATGSASLVSQPLEEDCIRHGVRPGVKTIGTSLRCIALRDRHRSSRCQRILARRRSDPGSFSLPWRRSSPRSTRLQSTPEVPSSLRSICADHHSSRRAEALVVNMVTEKRQHLRVHMQVEAPPRLGNLGRQRMRDSLRSLPW